MPYYIYKDSNKTGPYTREDILAMFEAQEVDDNTSIMHSKLVRWFPLNKLKDIFINGEDEAYFTPALFLNSNPPPSPGPVDFIRTTKINPYIPYTAREEREEMERILQPLNYHRKKSNDYPFTTALLVILGIIAFFILVAIIIPSCHH